MSLKQIEARMKKLSAILKANPHKAAACEMENLNCAAWGASLRR